WMRDFVQEAAVLGEFLDFAPPTGPLIEPELALADAMRRTTESLFPYATLLEFSRSHNLTPSQWRCVGDNQKALYRRRLLRRSGQARDEALPPFEFNGWDWHILFQLEAIVEYYANFDDPRREDAQPIQPFAEDG